ncbi:MAG: SH3 domain-containing protein [Eubacterium sp.]|nr:SH3 domain-containing protein [Eubacterium sp.]
MENKSGQREKFILSFLWSLMGILSLVAVCLGTWRYMESHNLIRHRAFAPESRDNLEIRACEGTVLATKSNALDGVPFYTEPGSTEMAGRFPEGKCIQSKEYTEINGCKWIHAVYCGLDGWLEESFTRPISRDARYIRKGTRVYVNALTEKGIKGYAKPDMESQIVREGLLYGDEFTIEALSDGWGRVTDRGETFWIFMYFMGSYPSEYWKIESLASSGGINLRKEPDKSSKSLGKVPENQPVKVLEFHRGWGCVDYRGQRGWLCLAYMSPDALPAVSIKYITPGPGKIAETISINAIYERNDI